jgi:hypothetical protein
MSFHGRNCIIQYYTFSMIYSLVTIIYVNHWWPSMDIEFKLPFFFLFLDAIENYFTVKDKIQGK